MAERGFDSEGIARLREVLAAHVDGGEVPGLAWALARRGQVETGAAGVLAPGEGAVRTDTIFRISSMTKPITAVATLTLVDDGVLALDDPVDRWLPELADRRVLAPPGGNLADTVPARRPISVRDLLTFRMGLGMDFTFSAPQPSMAALVELGMAVGPPAPAARPAPNEWMRRLGTVPLEHQPGERWLYHTGSDVLGVLIARASDMPFDEYLRARVLEPLGMSDTGFFVPSDARHRFGPCFGVDPDRGGRIVYDPRDGQWSAPPAFAGGGDGLVSTVGDYLAFATMLLEGGTADGRRVLSPSVHDVMVTDQLTREQRTSSGLDPSGAVGWGLGVGVVRGRTTGPWSPGTYSWDGGLGSTWANDPSQDLIGVLMTNQMWTSPTPPPVCEGFWAAAYAAISDGGR